MRAITNGWLVAKSVFILLEDQSKWRRLACAAGAFACHWRNPYLLGPS